IRTAVDKGVNQYFINLLPLATVDKKPFTILVIPPTKIFRQQHIGRFVIVTTKFTERLDSTYLAIFETNKCGNIQIHRLIMLTLLPRQIDSDTPEVLSFFET